MDRRYSHLANYDEPVYRCDEENVFTGQLIPAHVRDDTLSVDNQRRR